MAQHQKTDARIQSIDERVARLRAAKSRLLARANRTQRKRDTRRKILIGGAVLAAVDHEGMPAISSKSELLQWLDGQLTREHDRAVFDLALAARPAPTRLSRMPRRRGTAKRRVRVLDSRIGVGPHQLCAIGWSIRSQNENRFSD